MPETLQQPPLTNGELQQHLHIKGQQIQSYNPDLAGSTYVAPEDEALHRASYNWLENQTGHATEPLVNANERGEHILTAESLHADADELEAWIDSDISVVSRAIRDPAYARNTMLEIWKAGDDELPRDFTDEVGSRTGDLTLDEVKTFIELQKDIDKSTDLHDRDLHAASLDITAALIDNWAKRQDVNRHEDGMPVHDSYIKIKYGEAPEGVRPLNGHFSVEKANFAESFHELNRANIENLGKEVLDAAGVRQGLVEHGYYRDTGQATGVVHKATPDDVRRLIDNIDVGSAGEVATGTDPLANAKAQLRRLNIRTGGPRAETAEPDVESEIDPDSLDANRFAALERAVRDGTLLADEVPVDLSGDERKSWLDRKADQIIDTIVSRKVREKIFLEQRSLVRPEGGYVDPDTGAARYRELSAIDINAFKFVAHKPADLSQLMGRIKPYLNPEIAFDIDGLVERCRAKGGVGVGFNLDHFDQYGKPVLSYISVG